MSRVGIRFSVEVEADDISIEALQAVEIGCAHFCEQLEACLARDLSIKFPGIKFSASDDEEES